MATTATSQNAISKGANKHPIFVSAPEC